MVLLAVDLMISEFSQPKQFHFDFQHFWLLRVYILEPWTVPISRTHPSTPELKELVWFPEIIGRGRRIQSSRPSSSLRFLCKLEL